MWNFAEKIQVYIILALYIGVLIWVGYLMFKDWRKK